MKTIFASFFVLIAATVAAETLEPITLESSPPVVVQTIPAAGSDNVNPSLKRLAVTFSKKMQDNSWSWVQISKASFPVVRGKPRYLDGMTTNVLDVMLKPNQTYAIWLNSAEIQNFKDQQGRVAVPYLWVFRTAANKEKSTLEGSADREGSKMDCLDQGDKTIVDITSEFGIDNGTIRRTSAGWPKSVIVRLHLSGLESFKVVSGNVTTEWSIASTGDQATSVSLVSGSRVTKITQDSPYFAEVLVVDDDGKIPLKEGYFEVALPAKLFEANPEEIRLGWIDFYRN